MPKIKEPSLDEMVTKLLTKEFTTEECNGNLKHLEEYTLLKVKLLFFLFSIAILIPPILYNVMKDSISFPLC